MLSSILLLIELFVAVIGLFCSYLLFSRFPVLKDEPLGTGLYSVSVIIPARNEEHNLPLLLEDLIQQKERIHEIICVDDGSTDRTAQIVLSYRSSNVRLISLKEKPDDWTGKSWACHCGARAASGELLLFLDADVRLSPRGISKLVHAYHAGIDGDPGSRFTSWVISVQPYHQTKRVYEQFSMFFNLLQIAANGIGLPIGNKHVALYGPVILFNREDYAAIGGHYSAKDSILDDLTLAVKLKEIGIPYRLFLGDSDISFRMYGGGLTSLLQGWTKNIALAAVKTELPIAFMVFLWVTSCITVPLHLLFFIVISDFCKWIVCMGLYLLWVFELFRITRHVGNFTKWTVTFYPIALFIFLVIFIYSAFKNAFHLNVTWKDRKIKS